MRIWSDHLRNSQISLRQFSERRFGLLFAATAAAAARFLLLGFAAAPVALGHSGRAFIRRRLFIRNVRDHLRQLKVVLIGQLSGFRLLMTVPEEGPTNNHEKQGKARDD